MFIQTLSRVVTLGKHRNYQEERGKCAPLRTSRSTDFHMALKREIHFHMALKYSVCDQQILISVVS